MEVKGSGGGLSTQRLFILGPSQCEWSWVPLSESMLKGLQGPRARGQWGDPVLKPKAPPCPLGPEDSGVLVQVSEGGSPSLGQHSG